MEKFLDYIKNAFKSISGVKNPLSNKTTKDLAKQVIENLKKTDKIELPKNLIKKETFNTNLGEYIADFFGIPRKEAVSYVTDMIDLLKKPETLITLIFKNPAKNKENDKEI